MNSGNTRCCLKIFFNDSVLWKGNEEWGGPFASLHRSQVTLEVPQLFINWPIKNVFRNCILRVAIIDLLLQSRFAWIKDIDYALVSGEAFIKESRPSRNTEVRRPLSFQEIRNEYI